MYQSPTLVRYGSFRELTLQGSCPELVGTGQKNAPFIDPGVGNGQNTNDGCPARS